MNATLTLSDGTAVTVRPIRPDDAETEREFIAGLSEESRYLRLMGHVKELSEETLRRLTEINPDRETALIALMDGPDGKRQIGAARYVIAEDGKSCEFAIVVSDAWHGMGLGTALMTELIRDARDRGLTEMMGTTLPENVKMKALSGTLGFEIGPDPDDPHVVRMRLPL
jgi:acetyltransferase